MVGLITRAIAILFTIEMVVAAVSTKIGLYLETSPLPLHPAPPQVGCWAVLHEVRSDFAQFLTSLYLAIAGFPRARLQCARALNAKRRAHPALREPAAG